MSRPVLGLMAAGALAAGLAACAGSGAGPQAPERRAARHGIRMHSGTRVLLVRPVDARYRPKPHLRLVNGGYADSCGAGSDSAGNTYRCFGDGIYDPCWTDLSDPAVPAVICELHPWDTRATRLRLRQGGLEPFLSSSPATAQMEPWGVQLASGERCIAVQGAHDSSDGGRSIVDYECTPGGPGGYRVLVRGIARTPKGWEMHSAFFEERSGRYRVGPVVRVAIAWYAVPDSGDALLAGGSVCSASALAYAALAYESAHSHVDGPLPVLVSHVCEGPFAIARFSQDAPPPGYDAAFAFHATSSGWSVSGMSDYIEPGQFGIPSSVAARLDAALTSRPAHESVPF